MVFRTRSKIFKESRGIAFDEMRVQQKKNDRKRRQYQWHRRVVPILGAEDSAPNRIEMRKRTNRQRKTTSRQTTALLRE